MQHKNLTKEQRKEQALELNIKISEDMDQEVIEQAITKKLASGMKDLKNILDDISDTTPY